MARAVHAGWRAAVFSESPNLTLLLLLLLLLPQSMHSRQCGSLV
jgi:hypothetical protein